MQPTKTLEVIIKPTHECNLSCEYCYVSPDAPRGVMDESTLRNAMTKVAQYVGKDGKANFIWHGGEPLLLGSGFFRRVVEIHSELKNQGYIGIRNSVQTNGTLLTPKIADFFAEHGFSVGLSLDGPSEINHRTRRYANGAEVFDDVMKAISLCKERKIGGGFITVLSKKNIDAVDELFAFYMQHGFNVKVNPLIRSGRACLSFSELGITPKQYGEAMVRLFDLWYHTSEGRIRIDPLDSLIDAVMTGKPHGCSFNHNCQEKYISIGPTGDVYPCGRFDETPEFRYGNINTSELPEILQNPMRVVLLTRGADVIQSCAECEYVRICNAGCMHNAYIAGDALRKDYFCGGNRMIFEHITKTIKADLETARVAAH